MKKTVLIIGASSGMGIILALIGRASVEKLSISKQKKTSNQTFPKGMNRVEYDSQGKKIVGNLFIPEDYQEGEKRPAIVVAPASTAVKEHASGFYAEKFSKLGYITFAFDPRGIGESEGIEADCDPYHHANDVASSVSYLNSLTQVDSDKLLNVGVCAGAVSATYETFQDSRIKALGLVVPSIDGPERTRATFFLVRWLIYVVGGIFNMLNCFGINLKMPAIPPEDQIKDDNQEMKDLANYYLAGKVGYHPRWVNGISATSLVGVSTLSIFDYADKFDNIPVYVVSGENAFSLKPGMRFYNSLNGTKDSTVLEGATHGDFYWQDKYADPAVERIDAFFRQYV